MWDIYNDDDSFQRLARGRGFHDAELLAKVLYGMKQCKIQDSKRPAQQPKHLKVHFRQEKGSLSFDNSLNVEDCKDQEFEYLWRNKDYSFQPIKDLAEYCDECGDTVQTDIILFDRKISSEYDEEREELKDDLLEWNLRYQQRIEQKKKIELQENCVEQHP